MSDQIYFANEDQTKIADTLYGRVTQYYDEINRNGRLRLWQKIHRAYFALDPYGYHEASDIQRGGEQAELSLLKANHFRNLLQHLLVLITQQRPSFECRAINTDYESQIQTILGQNILEYYLRECRLQSQFTYAAEVAIAYSEAYVEMSWDADKGEAAASDLDPTTGEPTGGTIKTGDAVSRVYEPINVVRRCYSDGDQGNEWYILRRRESRYDLAAKYPDMADQIMQFSTDSLDDKYSYVNPALTQGESDMDYLPTFTFYHDRTPACPNGRYVKFLAGMALEYDDLPYPTFPVYPMIPSKQHGTSFGYSVSFDLLCVQEAIDLLYSTVLSNQSSFGVQNIWMKPGSNISTDQLAGGLNVIESMEKPEPINLTNTPAEIFKFLAGLESLGEVLSGVNSVARGQPEASLKSGSALALVASQAVQFSNGLQSAYSQLLEDSGTGLLKLLQTRAHLPRAAIIAGKDNKTYLKDFTAADLSSLNRVVVDIGNPVSRTIAGRIQMAQDLLQSQLLKEPQQYISVMETGTLEPLIDDAKVELLLINAENEAMREGKTVVSISIDEHMQHIKGHRKLLANPTDRLSPVLVQSVLNHIGEHVQALRTTDPGLLNALGQAPLAPNPNMAPPPPQGAQAPQPNAPQGQPPQGQPPQGQPSQQQPPHPPAPQPQHAAAPPNSPPSIANHMPVMPQPPQHPA